MLLVRATESRIPFYLNPREIRRIMQGSPFEHQVTCWVDVGGEVNERLIAHPTALAQAAADVMAGKATLIDLTSGEYHIGENK